MHCQAGRQTLEVIRKYHHGAKHYHGGRLKWLDTRYVNLINEEIRGGKGTTHVEIGFNERELAHRNVRVGICHRIYRKSPQVAENSDVGIIGIICIWEKSTLWESTNPW